MRISLSLAAFSLSISSRKVAGQLTILVPKPGSHYPQSLLHSRCEEGKPEATAATCSEEAWLNSPVLGGSGDLVSKVISTLIGVISNYKYSYLIYNPSY